MKIINIFMKTVFWVVILLIVLPIGALFSADYKSRLAEVKKDFNAFMAYTIALAWHPIVADFYLAWSLGLLVSISFSFNTLPTTFIIVRLIIAVFYLAEGMMVLMKNKKAAAIPLMVSTGILGSAAAVIGTIEGPMPLSALVAFIVILIISTSLLIWKDKIGNYLNGFEIK